RGVLTPAEMSLAQTAEGHSLIKQVRRQLLEGSRSLLEAIVQEKTGSQIKSLHTDISVRNSERVIVFTMAEDLEERFGWNKQERK
ncbi:MAG TPA: Na-translocating system protein MpsC family protein, partial [Anaerolineales bacterium]|nr:Na-translocating system protein MpsC family protein [Anaerolineales bacterium]